MSSPHLFSIVILCLTAIWPSAVAAEQPVPQAMRSRLSAALVRYAREVMGTEPLTVAALESGTAFLLKATEIDPDNLEPWRLLLDAAVLTEKPSLIDRSLRVLVAGAPEETGTRLRRLWWALEQADTLEAKNAMIQRLLTEESIEVIGEAVASELALRLALLHRRAGDIEAFYVGLDQALMLDPANHQAVALHTGLASGAAESDPVAWIGMLLYLYAINPSDGEIASEAGMFLLEHGAYDAAARMMLLSRGSGVSLGQDAGIDLDIDLATALWASGRLEEAEDILVARQHKLNERYRSMMVASETNRRSTLEVAQLIAPVSPKMATLQAMLASEEGDASAFADALAVAQRSVDQVEKVQAENEAPASQRAATLKRLLWLMLVLDANQGAMTDLAHRINALEPMDPTTQMMLDAAAGVEIDDQKIDRDLNAAAETTQAASLLLATRLQARGENREAAMALLQAWRRAPGTMLGVLARDRLAELLNQPVPMEPVAAEMSELVDRLPGIYDRLPREPSLLSAIRIEPATLRVGPFDPVIVNITVINHDVDPLAITSAGPIQDLILMNASVDVPYETLMPGPPFFVSLEGNLSIPGHGSVQTSLDLRSTWVGSALNRRPLDGARIEVDATLNPRIETGAISGQPAMKAGPLGGVYFSKEIQVDGVRVNEAWVAQSMDQLQQAPSSEDATRLAMLAFIVSEQDLEAGVLKLPVDQVTQLAAVLTETWPRIDPISQAWIATVLPDSDRLSALWDLVNQSADQLIQQIIMMRAVGKFTNPTEALDEPAIVAGLNSDDPTLRMLAEWVESMLQLRSEQMFGTEQNRGADP